MQKGCASLLLCMECVATVYVQLTVISKDILLHFLRRIYCMFIHKNRLPGMMKHTRTRIHIHAHIHTHTQCIHTCAFVLYQVHVLAEDDAQNDEKEKIYVFNPKVLIRSRIFDFFIN